MKKLVYLLMLSMAVFLTNSKLQAQSLVADTIIHYGMHDAVVDMLIAPDGEPILVGKMDTTDQTPKNIWVQRLGFQEDTVVFVNQVWEKIFWPSNSSRAGSAIWTLDSNFVITGSWNNNNMILKMSPEGDSLDILLFPSTEDTYFKEIIQLPDSDFIVLEVNVNEDLYAKMIRMNNDGTIVWEEEYDDRYYSSMVNFQQDTFMAAGYEYHQEYQHVLFGAYNPDGSSYYSNMFQWLYGYNYSMVADTACVYLGNSKEYLISADYISQVAKVDAQGEVEWDVDFSGIGSEVVKDMHLYDNYLITVSEELGFYFSALIIGAITFDGVLASSYAIPMVSPEAIAVDAHENVMYVTGKLVNGLNGRDVFLLTLNLDSLFVISNTQEYTLESDILVYPNPVDDRLYIKNNDVQQAAITSVSVYNLMGRLEKEMKMNTYSESWISLRDVPDGLYMVVIQLDDARPVTRKVLVVH